MRSTGDNFLAIVDLPVRIGGWSLPPNPDDHAIADFYSRLRRGEEPITSTPSPGAYLEAFRSLHCDRILCLTIPARWSAMDATARLAARMLAEEEGTERVVVMETGTAAAGLGLVARVAALHCRAGADLEEVRARAERACDQVRMFGALSTLVHVARGGRIPALLAGISDTLHLRPIFRLNRGEAGRVALARSDAGVLRALLGTLDELQASTPLAVLAFHADASALADRLAENLGEDERVVHCEVVGLAPVIGCHIGPGAVGLAALPLEADESSASTMMQAIAGR